MNYLALDTYRMSLHPRVGRGEYICIDDFYPCHGGTQRGLPKPLIKAASPTLLNSDTVFAEVADSSLALALALENKGR